MKKIEDQLKTMKFKTFKKRQAKKTGIKDKSVIDEICCICVDTLNDDTEIKVTSCNHYFHNDCLFKWVE